MNKNLPFVSICTPTFNRRPFFPYLIKCIENQNYPINKIEWIIIDDGTDPIQDLVENIFYAKYFYLKERMLLGKKRNYMHSKCSGDIIIYMDDDDYYPEDRISHAVETLLNNPSYLIAGSSEMHIYFKHLNKMYQFGPYKENHATAASFAFKKELLLITKYDESKALAEEPSFLKNYSIPLIQLNVLKTILVFSHSHNSFDKKRLLKNPEESKISESKYKISDFIKNNLFIDFYLFNIDNLLLLYDKGHPSLKPEILKQIDEMKEKRDLLIHTNNINNLKLYYENKINEKDRLINELLKKIKEIK